MSEKYHGQHEHASGTPEKQHIDIAKEVEDRLRNLEHEKNTQDEEPTESAEKLLEAAESEALSVEDIKTSQEKGAIENEPSSDAHLHYADLKKNTYRKRLEATQAQLSPSERQFSRFLHRSRVEAVSEIASKTIARPTGIAYGSIIACIGVSLSLFFAYRYGFSFNYLLFLLLFAGGYIVSTILELLFKQFRRSKSKDLYS